LSHPKGSPSQIPSPAPESQTAAWKLLTDKRKHIRPHRERRKRELTLGGLEAKSRTHESRANNGAREEGSLGGEEEGGGGGGSGGGQGEGPAGGQGGQAATGEGTGCGANCQTKSLGVHLFWILIRKKKVSKVAVVAAAAGAGGGGGGNLLDLGVERKEGRFQGFGKKKTKNKQTNKQTRGLFVDLVKGKLRVLHTHTSKIPRSQ